MIEEHLFNHSEHMSDLTVGLCNGTAPIHRNSCKGRRISLIDAGEATMTPISA
ncbi:MAG: hypothetical protein JSR96_14885 [Proteobacteria bacterium]|nr:hypothetical protein [Pseudomonadota bacterium]